MTRTDYRADIEEIAAFHGLNADLVEAVVWRESAGQADAFRYEANVWDRIKGHPKYRDAIARRVSSSYGLCQILLTTARQVGFPETDEPERLFIPRVNLEYGCRYLALLIKTFKGDVRKALGAYNAGPGNYASPAAQQYASRVLSLVPDLAVN